MPANANPYRQDRAAPSQGKAFRLRRFANWFPLGLTYATLYMGRYNFNVAKGAIGEAFHFSKSQTGLIATAGFWTYALAVLFNGPLADRIGGRRAILVGAAGACVLNAVIGALFLGHMTGGLLASLSILYAINMYFQSFGALSVVKVNSSWFHVRERGVLGGVFGAMISLGYFFAYDLCGRILAHFSLAMVYLIPSATILAMALVDFFLVRDRPSEAGYQDFPTGDEDPDEARAPSNEPVAEIAETRGVILRRVLKNPVIRTLIAAEFCTGIVRQGLLLYFPEFLKEVHHIAPGTSAFSVASTGITVGGICGGLLCGWLSDRVFESRRAPVAFFFYCAQVVALGIVALASPALVPFSIGFACVWIFGVHGMLSGTASMDFGGKRAAATAAGLLDGVQYLGSGLTGFGLGALLDVFHWGIWPWALIPFSIAGAGLMLPLWNARPGRSGDGH